MAEEFDPGEDGLAARQDAKLYPVGRALRATYDADNHDSLSRDVTALMLDLSRVPYDPEEIAAARREHEAASRRQASVGGQASTGLLSGVIRGVMHRVVTLRARGAGRLRTSTGADRQR